MGNITFDIKDHPVLNDIFEKGVVEGIGRGRLEGSFSEKPAPGPRCCCANSAGASAMFQALWSNACRRQETKISSAGPTQ
jgi:hypothetical protein